MTFIPYGRQTIGPDDIKAVVSVLKSPWLTQGPIVQEFEKKLARYCGARYAVAVSSGTAALHVACLAIGIENGDEVITSPISFVATSNSIIYASGVPVFVDIDPATINLDISCAEKAVTKRTKGILPVHFAGLPCDMTTITRLAKKHNLFVVEDACHALGAKYYDGKSWVKVGSCRHSDMTVFSFHPVKHITTGEGGAVTTNDKKLYERLLMLRTHGIVKDVKTLRQGAWVYEMRDLGFNYRLTDFQCALGISQLSKLDNFLKKRREIAAAYTKAFKNIPGIEIIHEPEDKRGAYHIFVLRIDFKKIKTTRSDFMNKLKELGVGSQVHYIPIHTQPFYRNYFKNRKIKLKDAEKYYSECLSIPLYPSLSQNQVSQVVAAVKSVIL